MGKTADDCVGLIKLGDCGIEHQLEDIGGELNVVDCDG